MVDEQHEYELKEFEPWLPAISRDLNSKDEAEDSARGSRHAPGMDGNAVTSAKAREDDSSSSSILYVLALIIVVAGLLAKKSKFVREKMEKFLPGRHKSRTRPAYSENDWKVLELMRSLDEVIKRT